jgi:hypothetical protein
VPWLTCRCSTAAVHCDTCRHPSTSSRSTHVSGTSKGSGTFTRQLPEQGCAQHSGVCLFLHAGRPLLVGSRPLQLWPLLLCKAILKVMAVYRSLDITLPHKVRHQHPVACFFGGYNPQYKPAGMRHLLMQSSAQQTRGTERVPVLPGVIAVCCASRWLPSRC